MKEILEYLTALEANNNAAWYHAHKAERLAACARFEELVGMLIGAIGTVDESITCNVPKELTFKLNRDTRFSHDKSPYNPCMRAHIGARGKLPVPVGYYIAIRPGDRTFLGGGLFADMFKDATAMIRDYVAVHGDELNAVVAEKNFAGRFKVAGSALQKVPNGYDPASPYAEWLKFKSMYIEYPLADEALLQPGFVATATEIFLAMKPFNDFLNRALQGFEMPARPQ